MGKMNQILRCSRLVPGRAIFNESGQIVRGRGGGWRQQNFQ